MAAIPHVPYFLQALIFGLLSAVSLPLGAVIGLACGPVSARINGWFMAFGSGALVYAVTVELYGEALCRLNAAMDLSCRSAADSTQTTHFVHILIEVGTGVIGAALYLCLNSCLQQQDPAELQEQDILNRSAYILNRSRSAVALADQLAAARADPSWSSPQQSSSSQARGSANNRLDGVQDSRTPESRLDRSAGSFQSSFHHQSRLPPAQPRLPPAPEGNCESRPTETKNNVALSMWLGITLDGIPESFMLGFMTNDGEMSWVLLVAVFVANFPEAFSAASLLKEQGYSTTKILWMWASVFLLTGVLAMIGSLIMPISNAAGSELGVVQDAPVPFMEGLTGGSMLAMVSTAMLPEAFHGAGSKSGILFVLGFMFACVLDSLGSYYGGPQNNVPTMLQEFWQTSY